MTRTHDMAQLAWTPEHIGEALQHLARLAGLDAAAAVAEVPPVANMAELSAWMSWAADRYGAETEMIDVSMSGLDEVLHHAGPALLQVATPEGPRVLVLLARRFGSVRVLDRALQVRRIALEPLRRFVCAAHAEPHHPHVDRVLELSGVSGRRADRVREALVAERLGSLTVARAWIVRARATSNLWAQLRHAAVPRRLLTMLALFAVTFGLEIAAWRIIGAAALDGRLDLGWLNGWSLLVLSIIPLQMAGRWLDATLALDVSQIVKTRLLAGALRLDPTRVRRQGAGHLLARVMESQAFESLALSLGIGSCIALVELVFAVAVLWNGAAGALHVGLLAACIVLAVVLSMRWGGALAQWTRIRLDITHALVERMLGHRTALAQEPAARRDREQDTALNAYVQASTTFDRAALPFLAALPNGWTLVGLSGLAPAFVQQTATPATLAISIGGILLAARALNGIVSGLSSAGTAVVAWQQIGPLFEATHEAAPVFVPPAALRPRDARVASTLAVVDADRLSYRYQADRDPVLTQATVAVADNDKVLIEGPSGGGKSTLASLIVGLRRPDAGMLLLNGLDRFTLGASWHQGVASAPQFHENHVLTGSLGFNLLMGRNWPATDDELHEADGLCRELGLGPLLDRMPAGLMQTVGETGWQLSHGERSRLFLARALLQQADMTVLDESFAALDPESLETCLDTVLRRTRTLAVIAHP